MSDIPQSNDSAVECTANLRTDQPDANILFVPPCQCPDCRDRPTLSGRRAGRDGRGRWLRLSADQQRLRVELLKLGDAGRSALG